MEINFSGPTIYMSHPIFGESGNVIENCEKAMKAARRLRRVFPEMNIYCPAEHEQIVQILLNDNRITTSDILWADIQILERCDGWFWYKFQESRGCETEQTRAEELGLTSGSKDIYTLDIEKLGFPKLRNDFADLMNRTYEHYLNRRRNTNIRMFVKEK